MNWEEAKKEACREEHVSAKGKISCSSLPALSLCGGHNEANAKVERVSKSFNEDGTALHYCMRENLVPEDLPEDLYDKMQKARSAVQYIQHLGWEILDKEKFRENNRLCGSTDVVFKRLSEENGLTEILILDFKFGWMRVDDETAQMLGYAELLWEEYPEAKIFTCVVQPELESVNIISIKKDDALREIDNILATMKRGVRVYSEKACQFCNACGTFACPETQKVSHELMTTEINTKEISLDNLRKFAKMIPIMTKSLAGFKEQVESALLSGEDIDGCYMKEGHMLYDIGSISETVVKLKGSVPASDIMASCKLSFASVKKILVENGVCSKKDALETAKSMLGETVIPKQTKPSLRYLK